MKIITAKLCLLLVLAVQSVAAAQVNFTVASNWGDGFQGQITIVNDGAQAISNWSLSFNGNFSITNHWNASLVTSTSNSWTFNSAGWNDLIPVNGSTSIGFIGLGSNPQVTNLVLTGNGVGGSPTTPTSAPTTAPTPVITPPPVATPPPPVTTPTPTPTPVVLPPSANGAVSSGRYVIISRSSGLAIDIQAPATENGANVQQWAYWGGANQQFDVTDLGNGYYSIRSAASGKSLDVWNWSTENGGEIRLYDYTGATNQQWQFNQTGNGYFYIVSRYSGKVLDIWNHSTVNGGDIRQYDYLGTTNQHWSFAPLGQTSAPSDMALVWSEEFNYNGLPDNSYWGYEQGLVRNNEAQYYTVARSQNAWVQNGLLTITAHRESYQGAAYTSASITTSGKVDWTYGRFEMRAKIDVRAGMWPAFWMLGYGKWPENGEIDIMEYYNNRILANVAWKANNADPWSAAWDSSTRTLATLRSLDPNWSDQFHIWHMDWDSNWIRLYVDGALMNETNLNNVVNPDGSNPFRGGPMYMIVNLAIGGNNGGDPSGTAFPATYQVDYIRVYQ